MTHTETALLCHERCGFVTLRPDCRVLWDPDAPEAQKDSLPCAVWGAAAWKSTLFLLSEKNGKSVVELVIVQMGKMGKTFGTVP